MNFNKILIETNVAVSHICPKYSVQNLDTDMIQRMAASTKEGVSYTLLDWKGLAGEDKQKLTTLFESINLKWKKTSDIT